MKIKTKTIDKLRNANIKTKMRFIKYSLKVMNRTQLENVIGMCMNNPEEEEVPQIIEWIKKIYIKKGWEWIYEI